MRSLSETIEKMLEVRNDPECKVFRMLELRRKVYPERGRRLISRFYTTPPFSGGFLL
jgi:hypothetical protein